MADLTSSSLEGSSSARASTPSTSVERMVATRAEVCCGGVIKVQWTVLDWNAPAVGFYRALGAEPMAEWTTQRMTGDALAELARR